MSLTVPIPIEELFGLAQGWEQAGKWDDAETALRRILDVAPGHANAQHLLGVVCYRRGHYQAALELMESAMMLGDDIALYSRNICELYRVLGRHEDAAAAAHRAVILNPDNPDALANQGIVLADQRRTDAAIESFERALRLEPGHAGAHFGLAEALLLRGDFARGWEEYEWRFRVQDAAPVMPPSERPPWDGKPLAAPGDTLLLVADQGFGDAIQFCRYIPWAAERCPSIALACAPELQPLMRQLDPRMRLFDLWSDRGEFAAWAPLSGLPRLAGARADAIANLPPYLRSDPSRRARWAARLDGLLPRGLRRIGLVWAGRPSHRNDHNRSTTLGRLAKLMEVADTAWVVLQKGPAQRQASGYYGRAPLVNLSAEIEDFQDTMAVIDTLDLVITVDTSVAHLAGAMGRPVWIMLPWASEWRWMAHRGDSPWYPTARLFRQNAFGDWDGIVSDIATCLTTVKERSLVAAGHVH